VSHKTQRCCVCLLTGVERPSGRSRENSLTYDEMVVQVPWGQSSEILVFKIRSAMSPYCIRYASSFYSVADGIQVVTTVSGFYLWQQGHNFKLDVLCDISWAAVVVTLEKFGSCEHAGRDTCSLEKISPEGGRQSHFTMRGCAASNVRGCSNCKVHGRGI
jgi:hypothetical protein